MVVHANTQAENKTRAIKTRCALLCKIDEGILHVETFKKANYTLNDAREFIIASIKLSHGEKIPVLFTLANLNKIDPEAIALIKGQKVCRITKAVALLIKSTVMRLVMQFYARAFSPPYPVRFFSSEDEAIHWLRKFL